jgi:NAD(P)-dependent dehydrogenase (short-subunit alcohol dehydrogenase family)
VREKVCVITGATSGIGLAAAEALATLGANLVLIARDPARGAIALRRLRECAPSSRISIHNADLERMSEMRRLGAELRAAYPRIDVLVNNAGAQFERRGLTEDGLERTFALNHMAYFLLTYELRERLAASTPARVINVASQAHVNARLDFDDLNLEHGYGGWLAYSRSKLANILFTRELARRFRPAGVTANALHPGFVASRFGYNNSGLFRIKLFLAKRVAISPETAAETIVHLASVPELATATGGYYVRSMPAEPSEAARDDAAARRLWDMSNEIAGLTEAHWGTATGGAALAGVDNGRSTDLLGQTGLSAGEQTSSVIE